MADFVIDASVMGPVFFSDERSEYANSVIRRLEKEEAVVPYLWFHEVAGMLRIGERRGRLTRFQSMAAVLVINSLPIRTAFDAGISVFNFDMPIAAEYGLSIYDAGYLKLAMGLNLPIATLDEGLRKAAKKAGVPIVGL